MLYDHCFVINTEISLKYRKAAVWQLLYDNCYVINNEISLKYRMVAV